MGCAGIIPPSQNKAHLDGQAYMVGAEQLPTLDGYVTKAQAKSGQELVGVVGSIAVDSQARCDAFLSRLALAQSSSDTGLDFLSTILALGTAFTPISTVHGLTAAATITGGWKSALDSDMYAKATIANYSQAVQTTYGKDIAGYIDKLSAVDATRVVVSLEYAKIQSIHAECSLASAQAAIAASLKPGQSSPAQGPQTQTLTMSAIAAQTVVTLSATSTSLSPTTISLDFPKPAVSIPDEKSKPAVVQFSWPATLSSLTLSLKAKTETPPVPAKAEHAKPGARGVKLPVPSPAAANPPEIGIFGSVQNSPSQTTAAVRGHAAQ